MKTWVWGEFPNYFEMCFNPTFLLFGFGWMNYYGIKTVHLNLGPIAIVKSWKKWGPK